MFPWISLCIKYRQCLWRPEEGIGSLGNGVSGSWEAPCKCWLGNETVLWKINHWVISPAHMVANFTGLLLIYLDTFTLAYVFKNKLVEKKGDQIALGLEISRWHRGAGEGRSSQFSCIQSSFTWVLSFSLPGIRLLCFLLSETLSGLLVDVPNTATGCPIILWEWMKCGSVSAFPPNLGHGIILMFQVFYSPRLLSWSG